jgi:hypothetical protein
MPDSVKPRFEILALLHEDTQTDTHDKLIEFLRHFLAEASNYERINKKLFYFFASVSAKGLEISGLHYYCR